MKIIDEKGRIFGKISIIDIFVIVILIAALVTVGAKSTHREVTSGGNVTIEFTVLVEGVRENTVEAFERSYSDLIECDSDKPIGDIVDIKSYPYSQYSPILSGEYVKVDFDDRYAMEVTVRANGSESKNGYYTASGKQIIVGDTLVISNGIGETSGEVISVKVIE